MESITNYAIFLDELRLKHHISLEDFCDGICEPRSFRRYTSGERNIPHDKISLFCNRVGLSLDEFYYSLFQHDKKEYIRIHELYVLIQKKKFEDFYKAAKKLNIKYIVSVFHRKFYQFCMIKADFETKKLTPQHAKDNFAALINYPKCISNNAFNFIDILCLSVIANIEVRNHEYTALKRLEEILTNTSLQYMNSESDKLMPSVYANVSLLYYLDKDYIGSLKIAEKGIMFSIESKDFGQLHYLHYMAAYNHFVLGNRKMCNIEAIQCLYAAILTQDEDTISFFHKMLIDDLGYDVLDDAKKYKDTLLKKDLKK